MTMRYCQSFDYQTLTQMSREGVITSNPTIVSGRNGNAFEIQTRQKAWTWDGDTSAAQQTVFIGAAVLVGSETFARDIFCLMDAAGIIHVALQLDSTRHLLVTRGGNGSGTTIISAGSTVLTANVYYYLEMKAVIDDSPNGSVEVRINGVTELNQGTLDTRNAGAAASVNRFRIGGWNDANLVTCRWDDLYFLDDQGSTNNTFLGDVRVEALFPNGNGNTSNLVGSDSNSTDNYLLVDEATSNDDTDYVESSTVGDKDTYAYTNLTPTSGTVYAVRPVLVARKSDAGARSVCSVARLSGTEVDSANASLSQSYQNLSDIRETKPGGGAWSVSDVNSAEFGMKVTV